MKVPRVLRRRFHELVWSHLPRTYPPSLRPLTILIPLAAKDVANARLCVAALRQHVKHPIEAIIVAGQDHDLVREFCTEADITYLNEKLVLPDALLNPPHIPKGHPINGWLRQQLLKLTAFDYIQSDTILTQDADTFMVRDISFMAGKKQVFYLSDEYTEKFYHFPKLLLGDGPRHPRSFVAHSMLWQRQVMQALDDKVRQNHGMDLVEVLLAHLTLENAAWLSEFEIYGNYMNQFQPDAFVTRYWYNFKLPANAPKTLQQLQRRYRRYNTVSAHIH